jgi:lipopolysaccharide transport system permease protein
VISEETIIEPSHGRFTLDLRGLVQYRDLLVLLVQRELSSKFRQTLLGPLWFVAQPCLTAAVYWFAFYRVATLPTGGIPSVLFFLSSVTLWTYFSQSCSGVAEALNHHAHLMTKVHFPRLIVPLSIVTWRLFPLLLQLFTLGIVYCVTIAIGTQSTVAPSAWLPLALPLIVAVMGMLALGTGLFIAACTVRFRDLHHLFALMLQLWMFATPVVYPLSTVPVSYRNWMVLNPMTGIFETARYFLFGIPFEPVCLFISLTVSALIFSVGLYSFQRVERTFVDTI